MHIDHGLVQMDQTSRSSKNSQPFCQIFPPRSNRPKYFQQEQNKLARCLTTSHHVHLVFFQFLTRSHEPALYVCHQIKTQISFWILLRKASRDPQTRPIHHHATRRPLIHILATKTNPLIGVPQYNQTVYLLAVVLCQHIFITQYICISACASWHVDTVKKLEPFFACISGARQAGEGVCTPVCLPHTGSCSHAGHHWG